MSPEIKALADAVERRFDAMDLHVTMGGEPTFIPEHPEGDEWNQGALGPEKLGYARRLARRLLRTEYPGAVVMQVFGKQYPGEPLPRWVVLLLQRNDRTPLWSRPDALLLDDVPGPHPDGLAHDIMQAIAKELELRDYVLPCFESDSDGTRAGWVLPLDWADGKWRSDQWPYAADEPVTLAPGESPIGLRLPLADLDEGKLRRALTVEVKNGSLHVFFPPLELDGFAKLVELVARVTEAANVEGVVLCGYRPEGATEALTSLGLAADPGVLEVNLPPTSSWHDYDALLARITAAAAEEGLKTTRLHLNGQVQGTGGGAHLLFGGPTLDENPFFARPDILASVIRYWQAHPCLSYFFSGQYVGPGSQAPRADETLASRLYELETACAGVDQLDEAPDRGFLDRLFRNLMTDSGGNTHRAEICLDKLWNGASPTGLQGLVELRAFETMPDVALQSRAALFTRAIVAMLASEPRVGDLRRFDATLHDLYLLPSGLWSDVHAVCDELTEAGLPFDAAWLRDLMAHRFPVLGTLEHEGLEVIVRQALEPWPLMAEVSHGGATSRLVDNSTDRIEIAVADSKALGAHRVLVNGIELALREVEVEGTANRRARIGAVRYKSADGWPALHPHISVQSPLTIELIDGTGKVVSAAQYHHWNPDGSAYDAAPRAHEEAERRRRERWVAQPDAVGQMRAPIAGAYGQEAHYTLDFRRQNHP